MGELTVDHAPRIGTRVELPDGPALLFRILQGFANLFVSMVDHFLAFSVAAIRLDTSIATRYTSIHFTSLQAGVISLGRR